MFVRRSPAVLLSFVLSAAALASAPSALASDGGTAKDARSATSSDAEVEKDVAPCSATSTYKLKVTLDEEDRLLVVGSVYSSDTDAWSWKLKHNGDYSFSGEKKAKDAERSFRVVRTMVDLAGPDVVEFRAENELNAEVCKGEVAY